MNVTAVMDVAKQFDGQVIAGDAGLGREVNSIEVMEVPEVADWATEGVMVVTTFYSVKDDLAKQLQIVKVLIDKNAAGLVVKLGRFIDSLPEAAIQLAEDHHFPIIIVPKHITYFELLTPLYEQLNEKHIKSTMKNNIFTEFVSQSYTTVEDALECLSDLMNSPVYIEDVQGRLLYSTDRFTNDDWRDSRLLFSVPIDKDYVKKLKEWNENEYTHINLPGKRRRCVIPIKVDGVAAATIHLTYKNKDQINSLVSNSIQSIKNKVYEVMMSEVIEQQQLYMKHIEKLSERAIRKNEANILLYFNRDLNQLLQDSIQSILVNYHGLFRKEINRFVQSLTMIPHAIIMGNQTATYVLLSYPTHEELDKTLLESAITKWLAHPTISDTSVSISTVFMDISHLEKQKKAVLKTMQIGKEIYPQNTVYSYGKLGIYEFLIKLSTEPTVHHYVDEVIRPIYDHSDKSLLNTLSVYLEEGGNATKAAEKLFIHRRTMTNRLQRIKAQLNMDINEPENIFILQFCLKIKNLDLK